MRYNVYYYGRGEGELDKKLYAHQVDRETMINNRKYLIKSKVIPMIFLGDIEIEVTDDDK